MNSTNVCRSGIVASRPEDSTVLLHDSTLVQRTVSTVLLHDSTGASHLLHLDIRELIPHTTEDQD